MSFPQHVELSSEIRDLLEKLLSKEEKYRLGSYIGIKEILFHPWVGKVKPAEILGKQMEVPYAPSLLDYNFDATELGDDEQEYSALVHEEVTSEGCRAGYREYHRSEALSHHRNPMWEEVKTELQEQRGLCGSR